MYVLPAGVPPFAATVICCTHADWMTFVALGLCNNRAFSALFSALFSAQYPAGQSGFNTISVLGGNLTSDEDQYHTRQDEPSWNRGPNVQFYRMVRYMTTQMQASVFYYMEGDSIPLAAGWLDALVCGLLALARNRRVANTCASQLLQHCLDARGFWRLMLVLILLFFGTPLHYPPPLSLPHHSLMKYRRRGRSLCSEEGIRGTTGSTFLKMRWLSLL